MNSPASEHSWFGPAVPRAAQHRDSEQQEFGRLWQGFMTGRLVLGFVLMVLQGVLYATATSHSKSLVVISTAYFGSTLASWLWVKPRPLGGSFNRAWGALVGLDLLVFSVLQLVQGGNSINYTPLFALPILLASVLGSLRLALGTAAGVTVLLLGGSLWNYLYNTSDSTPYFVQAALSGLGYFMIALLANQLSSRLVSEGQRARLSQLAANVQRQVNELVIESLPDGILVVDDRGSVRAANPAARRLLGAPQGEHSVIFDLRDEAGWLPLLQLTRLCVSTGHNQKEDVTIRREGRGPHRVRAQTRLAAPLGHDGDSLCVLFLQDQRELEARMRTERLASMGRMSTAVAHEIRNPLAAIAQANALLDEDLEDPRLKRLTAMVGQNAKRLEKIVDDILNVSRVQSHDKAHAESELELSETIQQTCTDWAQQSANLQRLSTELSGPGPRVRFDAEHLRRVLVNLLDNASRYAGPQPEALQVSTAIQEAQSATISVWSNGAPMDQSVERHLFEPFFSSESRSSGLGLFICRELCEGHGASILYQRNVRSVCGVATEGNEFVITVARSNAQSPSAPITSDTSWQPTLY